MSIEVTQGKTQEIEYPVARRSVFTGVVVLFLTRESGICLVTGHSLGTLGKLYSSLTPVDSTQWEPVEVTIKG